MTNPESTQRNDARMLAMMVEMTRYFCGDEKANQINDLTQHVATEEQWQEIRLRSAFDVWEPAMLEVSRWLTDMDWPTIEQIIAAARRSLVLDRIFWGGLLHYATGPARPTYLGQEDKALHYCFGAWADTIHPGLGADLGLLKEQMDRVLGTGQYDEADIQATVDGAMEARKK